MKGILFFLLLSAGTVWATDLPAGKINLRGMDKITGRVSSLQTDVGQSVKFEKLDVFVDRCYTTPADETPESKAFLTITETLPNGAKELVFRGWMFASDPAFSAMEHPVYDIWVFNCTTPQAGPVAHTIETVGELNVGPSLTDGQTGMIKGTATEIPGTSDEDEAEGENLAEDIVPKELLE